MVLLIERHRAQAHSGNSTGASVAHKVISRSRGTGKYEPAHSRTEIGRATHMVPDFGSNLPFVEQSGEYLP